MGRVDEEDRSLADMGGDRNPRQQAIPEAGLFGFSFSELRFGIEAEKFKVLLQQASGVDGLCMERRPESDEQSDGREYNSLAATKFQHHDFLDFLRFPFLPKTSSSPVGRGSIFIKA